MKNPSILDRIVLGYSPVFDPRRKLCGLRLSVAPLAASAEIADGEALWSELDQVLSQAPAASAGLPALWVSVASEALMDGLLQAAQRNPKRLLIEVPSFLASTREPLLQALGKLGQPLVCSGWVRSGPPSVQPLGFGWTCDSPLRLEPAAAKRGPADLPWLLEGARWEADFERAFALGAAGVAGWPMDEEPQVASPAAVPAELHGVVELMNRVEREEPVERLEAVLTADPSLAYRLLRYLNASAFGLRAEVGSFRHGLQMLGYRRLKRWLALLLVSGSQDPKSRVLMAVAARRGLILDELASGFGDETMRGELFICGVFSLLDRMLRVPMGELVRSVPMPERVQSSLLARGPYSPHLELLQAIEGGLAADIREKSESALVALGELNRAVLKGLTLSWGLD